MPWLLCNLQPIGKRLVRGAVDAPEKFWTFCPKKKFPRDRVLIKECEGCPHFKGYRIAFTDRVMPSLPDHTTPRQMFESDETMFAFRKSKPRVIREKDLIEAIKEKRVRDEEWEEEERRTMKEE